MEDMYQNDRGNINDKELELSVEKIYQEFDVSENDQRLSNTLPASFTGSANTHGKSLKIGINGEQWTMHQRNSSSFVNRPVSNRSSHSLKTDFKWIEETLQKCDGQEWQKYLYNFKKHKVTESRLYSLSDKDWRELIPEIGIRNDFIQYAHSRNDRGKSFEFANTLVQAFSVE